MIKPVKIQSSEGSQTAPLVAPAALTAGMILMRHDVVMVAVQAAREGQDATLFKRGSLAFANDLFDPEIVRDGVLFGNPSPLTNAKGDVVEGWAIVTPAANGAVVIGRFEGSLESVLDPRHVLSVGDVGTSSAGGGADPALSARVAAVETKQGTLAASDAAQGTRLTAIETKQAGVDTTLTSLDTRLDAVEAGGGGGGGGGGDAAPQLGEVRLLAAHEDKTGFKPADGRIYNDADYAPELAEILAIYSSAAPVATFRTFFDTSYGYAGRPQSFKGAAFVNTPYQGQSRVGYTPDGLAAPVIMNVPGIYGSGSTPAAFGTDGNRLVGIGALTNLAFTDGDGRTLASWSGIITTVITLAGGTAPSSSTYVRRIRWNPVLALWVCVAIDGSTGTSHILTCNDPTMVAWKCIASFQSKTIQSFDYDPNTGCMVFCGMAGFSARSADGITVETFASRVTQNLNDVRWIVDRFAMVGSSGRLVTTIDGTSTDLAFIDYSMDLAWIVRLPNDNIVVGGNSTAPDGLGKIKSAPSLNGPWTDSVVQNDPAFAFYFESNGTGGVAIVNGRLIMVGRWFTNGYPYPAFATADAQDISASQFRAPYVLANGGDASYYVYFGAPNNG